MASGSGQAGRLLPQIGLSEKSMRKNTGRGTMMWLRPKPDRHQRAREVSKFLDWLDVAGYTLQERKGRGLCAVEVSTGELIKRYLDYETD